MNILIIDAQGGGIGKQLVPAIKQNIAAAIITAVGTNSIAASAMLKAGADNAATGKNAVVVCCRKADVIIGPVGIVIADSLLGEITPAMAVAVGQSSAKRILIPINHCDNIIVGVPNLSMERPFEAGALEVFTVPIGMKKSRHGILIRILCREQNRENIIKAVFKYTTTIGVREVRCSRYVMERSITPVQTPFGEVRRKDSTGYGVTRSKYEYDDIARIAKEHDISIADVILRIENK